MHEDAAGLQNTSVRGRQQDSRELEQAYQPQREYQVPTYETQQAHSTIRLPHWFIIISN